MTPKGRLRLTSGGLRLEPRRGTPGPATAYPAGGSSFVNGGTLFLDEIGDLPLDLPLELLRMRQEGEVLRVVGAEPGNIHEIGRASCRERV